jgi:hypothetical protein
LKFISSQAKAEQLRQQLVTEKKDKARVNVNRVLMFIIYDYRLTALLQSKEVTERLMKKQEQTKININEKQEKADQVII